MSKLSAKLIESIKPTDKRQRVPDTTVQGLSLVVQPSGKKLFQYRYRFDKRDKSVTIGTVPAMTLKEARDKAIDFRRMLDVNTDPLHNQRQQKAIQIERTTNSTIGAAMQRYEAEKLDKLRSGDNAKSFLREFKADYSHLELANFSKDVFREMLRGIVEQGHSVKANRVHTHVRTFMNWAEAEDLIEYNHLSKVKKPVKEVSRDRFLSDSEIKLFWQATAADLEPWGNLYRLLLLTGQRLNECARMTEDELITPDHWHLASERVKNKKQHDVFLSKQAQAIVLRGDRIANDKGLIFTTNGTSFLQSFDKPTKRLRARMNELAGRELKHFNPHDLRRTCETGLAMLGTPQPIIDRITNHASVHKMARVYNMWEYRAEKTAALQKWADHVEGLVS
jgi:integrase